MQIKTTFQILAGYYRFLKGQKFITCEHFSPPKFGGQLVLSKSKLASQVAKLKGHCPLTHPLNLIPAVISRIDLWQLTLECSWIWRTKMKEYEASVDWNLLFCDLNWDASWCASMGLTDHHIYLSSLFFLKLPIHPPLLGFEISWKFVSLVFLSHLLIIHLSGFILKKSNTLNMDIG